MSDLLGRSEAALAEAGPTPLERYDAVVESLLRFHMYRRAQAFVSSTEIRSLDPAFRTDYIQSGRDILSYYRTSARSGSHHWFPGAAQGGAHGDQPFLRSGNRGGGQGNP